VERAATELAAEALCAARGLDLRAPLRPGAGVRRGHAIVRAAVPALDGDRPPGVDITTLAGVIRDGALAAVGGEAAGG